MSSAQDNQKKLVKAGVATAAAVLGLALVRKVLNPPSNISKQQIKTLLSNASCKDKHVIITGASRGVGFETAKYLVQAGANVYMICRNKERGANAVHRLQQQLGNALVDTHCKVLCADLSDVDSVRACVQSFLSFKVPLHVLINAASTIEPPFGFSKEGIEIQFSTNFLGHFLLTQLLLPSLKQSSGRIVNLVAKQYESGSRQIHFASLKEDGCLKYTTFELFAQSQLALLMFTAELNAKLAEEKCDNVFAVAVYPGNLYSTTNRHDSLIKRLMKVALGVFYKHSSEEGARSVLYAAFDSQNVKSSTKVGGNLYFEEDKPVKTIADIVKDSNLRKKLYVWAEEFAELALPSETVTPVGGNAGASVFETK